jgi:hypothetical protein
VSARDLEGDEESSVFASKLESMRKVSEGVPDDVVPVLLVFCAAYAHLLMVLDDEEFYELQVFYFHALGQFGMISLSIFYLVKYLLDDRREIKFSSPSPEC